MTRSAGHDTLADRLTLILCRLNQGHTLHPADLADEFAVSVRTIQRDLSQRLGQLGDLIERTEDGGYRMAPQYFGKLTLTDLERFAALTGLSGLYPVFDDNFVRELLDSRLESVLQVRGHSYEALDSAQQQRFRQVEAATRERQLIGFRYRKPEGEKTYEALHPYRLVNHTGIWYLMALDGSTLKSFAFSRISALLVSPERFEPEPALTARLDAEDGIWLNEQKTEVVLKVSRDAAGYFLRRKLVPAQEIVRHLEDGSLLVSSRVAHPNQILPIVRYWVPNVRIVSPEGWQKDLKRELATYVSQA
ncbi:hypothetical protein X805_15830 [Sphaerotilus natans subsp. natans DSM 6575]|uniref:HTH deoR-type domain-containing protein n=1 Tax=Sphaerotilus natans subsp. natans DSM 6575 TaxID=1286631 RepID=A0A059KNN8_9BURK|nr:WYL domain-containing protein [Sphaerotilus natans]KDB52849.1 hypothetical protein X805_15830 [Sphaerotilus natans subsp. natans DSM 6575]SIR61367.1 Predicted DNA-binding transcriptional regulator YafY, contains an HTH and WYL domains [Sphaerotilus natans]